MALSRHLWRRLAEQQGRRASQHRGNLFHSGRAVRSVQGRSSGIVSQPPPTKLDLSHVPSLQEYLLKDGRSLTQMQKPKEDTKFHRHRENSKENEEEPLISYYSHPLAQNQLPEAKKTVFIESYGCQMNISDTEIVYSIMKKAGYEPSNEPNGADIIFLNTCAIRDKAEQKIWQRLSELKNEKKLRKKANRSLLVGVLGCMAERLKEQLLEKEKMVDLVVGPDAYRDLPRLIPNILSTSTQAINVTLSLEETYADISPVRSSGIIAYVSIMRGCNNMCTYCIVPFTRGRERSRPINTIIEEIKELKQMGIKEVILLGQNVNSYNDLESADTLKIGETVEGFETVYGKRKVGVDFTELVKRVSMVDEEMRIRFTSPHPKDFPDGLLDVIKGSVNVCKSLHVPAQSGSTTTLARMRRGYTRESYIRLIDKMREIIPDITLSSDFISGFCGETEEEHKETIALLEEVKFDSAFMFAYSMREKTPAHRKYKDDVPEEVKKRRLQEVIDTFHRIAFQKNASEIGNIHLILIEGKSRRSDSDLKGRTDNNKKVIIPDIPIPDFTVNPTKSHKLDQFSNITARLMKPGDYVVIKVESSSGLSLKGKALGITYQKEFWNNRDWWERLGKMEILLHEKESSAYTQNLNQIHPEL